MVADGSGPRHGREPWCNKLKKSRLRAAGEALEGPDTDTLTGEHRDQAGQGIHFSAKGLEAHGRLWAVHVLAWLERLGSPPGR